MNQEWPVRFESNVNEVVNSDFYKNLRKKALAGERIDGCAKCYSQEDAGTESLRTVTNRKYPLVSANTETTRPQDIEVVELFTGDTCNLKCVTCRPQLSTKWREDYKKLGWPLEPRAKKKTVSSLFRDLDGLKEIKLVGGEPLLDPEHSTLLRTLVDVGAAEMKLVYFTNGTIFPSKEIFKLWDHFKEVEIFFSIDGIGKVNDYIRHPSKWEQVDRTLDLFLSHTRFKNNFIFRVATTVSILNIWYLKEIEAWYQLKMKNSDNKNLKQLIFNPLVDPEFMSARKIPQSYLSQSFGLFDRQSENQMKIYQWIKQGGTETFSPQLVTYLEKRNKQKRKKPGFFRSERGSKSYVL